MFKLNSKINFKRLNKYGFKINAAHSCYRVGFTNPFDCIEIDTTTREVRVSTWFGQPTTAIKVFAELYKDGLLEEYQLKEY